MRIWITNSNPKLVGHWYLEHLMETRTISQLIRLGKGTETGVMATMPPFLRRHDDNVVDPVLYDPSTLNQVRNN